MLHQERKEENKGSIIRDSVMVGYLTDIWRIVNEITVMPGDVTWFFGRFVCKILISCGVNNCTGISVHGEIFRLDPKDLFSISNPPSI